VTHGCHLFVGHLSQSVSIFLLKGYDASSARPDVTARDLGLFGRKGRVLEHMHESLRVSLAPMLQSLLELSFHPPGWHLGGGSPLAAPLWAPTVGFPRQKGATQGTAADSEALALLVPRSGCAP
jgi:hypothetical protein